MSKFTAPEYIDHFCFDNVEYRRDEDGEFFIQHPDHQRHAVRHGAVPVGQGVHHGVPVAPVQTDQDARIAELEAQLAEARAQLASPPAPDAPVAPEATDTPADPADASGDTSEATGGTTGEGASDAEATDKMAEALAAEPKFEDMTRDELVDWLAGVGVSVPGNLSKDKALEIVNETVADYKASKAE